LPCRLQDASGQRIIRSPDGSWLLEAADLPAVTGSPSRVEVSPCPGLVLAWTAASSAVTISLADGWGPG
jgi:hypothetical protein